MRQITEPTYCLPCGADGSSSYSTTRCATGAICVEPGCPTRSVIFGRVPEASFGAVSACCCAGLVSDLNSEYAFGPPQIAAPMAMIAMPTAMALLSGKPRLAFSGSSRVLMRARGRSDG